jgi:glucose-6-phosphate 1-dehydrogenase
VPGADAKPLHPRSESERLRTPLAIEPPDSLAPEDVRDRKGQLLAAVRPFSADELVRRQYAAGVVDGHEVCGHRDEERVAPESTAETFVALRAWIDNARWKDVPFFLGTGKRLPHRATEVAIVLIAAGGAPARRRRSALLLSSRAPR